MRRYHRFMLEVPIEIDTPEYAIALDQHSYNLSQGGLAFISEVPLPAGTLVQVRIPLVDPVFECEAEVKHCCRQGSRYEVGLMFTDPDDAYRSRMVEQMCCIEIYKKRVWQEEGRQLSTEAAAAEWIGRYAADFAAGVRP
ncbi:PilZ domain-containing protein [Balneatrix alpica]|uniref:PilZ domain-containing protein n=1 Tax=Balneatrix alpica TaxID=75684 RepID=A0ABV5ZBZ0_9GAMM|nr:PilZ domain-containing protein [Balneatrix alpica]